MIRLENINFKYKNSNEEILSDVSLKLEEGKVLAIVGPSGGGKSTLLRIISGLEKPDQGKIMIANRDATSVKAEKRSVGMLFQDYALFPHMTIAKNIAYGITVKSKSERKRIVTEMLDLVDMLGYEKRYPHELSGGQQQRIALARALAAKPKILLLDEPFSNLDTELIDRVRKELFLVIRKTNITTIMVTHNQEDANLADNVVKIEAGKVTQAS